VLCAMKNKVFIVLWHCSNDSVICVDWYLNMVLLKQVTCESMTHCSEELGNEEQQQLHVLYIA